MRTSVIVCIAATGLALAGCGTSTDSDGEKTATVTKSATEKPQGKTSSKPAASKTPKKASASIPGNGTFVVGTDIKAGTYRTTGPADSAIPNCYWGLHAMGIDVPDQLPTLVVVGVVDLADIVDDSPSRWAVDEYWHWQFTNSRPLSSPVPLLGRQSLFRAPADVEQRVMAQL